MTAETMCIGLARIGSDTQKIMSGSLLEMSKNDLGEPLHCFIVSGNLHPMEAEFLEKIKQIN
jgi:diphthine synthase